MTDNYSSKYPYFIYPAVMALRRGLDDPAEELRLRRIIAANVGDIPSLRLMLGIDPEEFGSFYPDLTPTDISTNETISSFLDRFGSDEGSLPQAATDIAPIPEKEPEIIHDDLNIISPTPAPAPQKTPLTEQNARNLIKKRDYQGALEIIQHLILNIPEKSVYFADQIRFLKKLIVNEARKTDNKTTS